MSKKESMMRFRTRVVLLVLSAAVLSGVSGGPELARGVQAEQPDGGAATTAASLDHRFNGLSFRAIGPAAMSGRIDDVAVLETDPSTFYVAAATGGLWKTTNGGTTWEVLFDDQPDVVSIGDIAIPADDPQLVWLGSGENNNRNSSSWGNGVYKSTDGGHTWEHMGLADSHHIGRVLIDPDDTDVVWVAATGRLWGPSSERGVYRTRDGGQSWDKVLFTDEDTGATDLAMDPANPDVVYAATYQRRRTAWGFNGGGPGSGIFKTTDGGRTWTRLTVGLPEGPMGRIALDVYRADPRVVYATVEHADEGGLYRTDDGGASWRRISELNPRPMFFSQVRVDPRDQHRVYVLGVSLHVSDDGGRTFVTYRNAVQQGLMGPTATYNSSLHTDQHAMWIDPADSDHLIVGNDGGVYISRDGARTWDFIDNMDLGQLYRVGFDMDWPYRVYLGLQDNIGWGGPNEVRSYLGIRNGDWFLVAGGDGFASFADPNDSRTIYAESQHGNVARVDRLTNERKPIRPRLAEGEPELRWNWDTPMMLSPHDSDTLLMGANRLFRSTDRGHSWTAVSPDLTAAIDREELSIMGVLGSEITIAKHDGVSAYGTLTAITESPLMPGLYYTGADDGSVQVSRDGGNTWQAIGDRFPGLPPRTWVSDLVASAHAPGTAYATFDGHRGEDMTPHVYVTTDSGETWRRITDGIPEGHAVRCLAEDLVNPDVLYAGTELGLFFSRDGGGAWRRWRANLPTVPIYEIALHPRENDMILATHGRSIWILDDLGPMQEAAALNPLDLSDPSDPSNSVDPSNDGHYLFAVRDAVQFNRAHDRWWMVGDREFLGENSPFGAIVSYQLGQPAEAIEIAVRDAGGEIVRRLRPSASAMHGPGVHRMQWDLRHEPLAPLAPLAVNGEVDTGVEVTQPYFGRPQTRSHSFRSIGRELLDIATGPFVLPGRYTLRLEVDGRDVGIRDFEVLPDPWVEISPADRRAWHDAALEAHTLQDLARRATTTAESLRRNLEAIRTAVATAREVPAALTEAVESLETALAEVETRLAAGGPRRRENVVRDLASVKGDIMGSTTFPTEIQQRSLAQARTDLEAVVQEVNRLIAEALPELYRVLSASALPAPELEPLLPISAEQP